MLVDLLKNEFQQRKDCSPQYSMRAFAKSLKMHSSTLCVILSRKRKLTPKQAEKILREINIDVFRKKQILLSLIDPALQTNQSQALEKMESADLTFRISAKKILAAKKMISALHQELTAIAEAGSADDEIYHLNIQLYPS